MKSHRLEYERRVNRVIDYIRKPFAMERLLESVAKGLSIEKPPPPEQTENK